jgi:RNA recognition motif-containing protein
MIKIYIGNLPSEVNDKSLKERFETYGIVDNAHIITDRATGESRCFGFVEMQNQEEVDNAITNLHESDWNGNSVAVNISKPRERKG